ncbi:MAG: OmpA family protein [Alphaproteobacteria bacterium]|nr:OmpA family protein [Alphaproteobacteria bacterium]
MRYTVTAAAGLGLLASSVPASAQLLPPPGAVSWQGPHVGLSIGGEWSRLSDSVSVAPTPAGAVPGSAAVAGSNASLRSAHRGNVTGGGQLGYDWQLNNLVFGVEGDIRGGGPSVSTTIGAGSPNLAAGDNFKADSDFNASVRGRLGYAWNQFLFYGTGGVAFADAHLRANYPATTIGGLAVPGSTASGSTTLIGPTGGGGIEYAVSPNLSVAGEYRYTDYGHDTIRLGSVPTAAAGGLVASAPVTGRIGLRDNTLLFKVNYRFGAPLPPPPMPAAAPAPPPPPAPKVFIVFFDWDRDTITAEGRQIVRQAADAYRTGAPVQIQVTGYTDRSGSPGYNQRLSERRANNVANALASLGVPRNQMLVSGRGENDNRVPTADGVREPQNRRVEITAP